MSKMDKNIAFLIDALNEEKARLKEFIQSSIEEREFLIAHYHSEALGRAARQFQIIRNLDDRNYDTKRWLASDIKGRQQWLRREREEIRELLESQIEKNKLELKRLNEEKKVSSKESNILNQYLTQFVDGKVHRFKLLLSKKDSLSLEFKRENGRVTLSIPKIQELIEANVFSDEDLVNLNTLGFTHGEDNCLTLTIITDDNLVRKLKFLLCKIVFELMYYEELQGQSFIEIEK
jgi:hypothetical protein